MLSLQPLRDTAHVDGRVEPLRVHLVHARSEQEIDARLFHHGEVAVRVTWVLGIVLGRPELRGVDEDARDKSRVVGARAFQQRTMPGVERAHRGNEAQCPLGGCTGRSKPVHRLVYLHAPYERPSAEKLSSSPGKLPDCTSATYRRVASMIVSPTEAYLRTCFLLRPALMPNTSWNTSTCPSQ